MLPLLARRFGVPAGDHRVAFPALLARGPDVVRHNGHADLLQSAWRNTLLKVREASRVTVTVLAKDRSRLATVSPSSETCVS